MKELEYPDAPSGFVTLYNYKEPFMPYQGGYGYEGVLLFDGIEDRIQCHLCGGWFEYLSHHLHGEHSMTARDYKSQVGLAPTTALISEKYRAKLIQAGTDKRMKNLRSPKSVSAATRKKISDGLKKWAASREKENKMGTCPEQLLQRVRDKFEELGRTPTQKELKGYDTIRKVWGSYRRACEMAGIPYREPRTGRIRPQNYKYSEEEIVAWIVTYVDKNGKLPAVAVWNRMGSKVADRFGGWKYLCDKALKSGAKYKIVNQHKYTTQDLLELLREFKKENKRNPSTSDCKRKLLPYVGRYLYHWGTWRETLKAAGL